MRKATKLLLLACILFAVVAALTKRDLYGQNDREGANARDVPVSAAAALQELLKTETETRSRRYCHGTLNFFEHPSCQACNAERWSCISACQNHGGLDYFSCSPGGLDCVCNDGAYDSCSCW